VVFPFPDFSSEVVSVIMFLYNILIGNLLKIPWKMQLFAATTKHSLLELFRLGRVNRKMPFDVKWNTKLKIKYYSLVRSNLSWAVIYHNQVLFFALVNFE